MNKRNTLKLIASYALLTGAIGTIVACSEQKPAFSSIDVTGADYAKDFALTDHNGQPKSLKDFAGKVVVMFFGYTQCPDVCPTTMAELAEIKKLLGADGSKLQGVFVTIDPERDTPEVLKAYMGNFDPTFLALVPTPTQLAALAKVTQAEAQDTALKSVNLSSAKVTSAELEAEGGCLIYSFDIDIPGRKSITEVTIDAGTGKLLSRKQEGPKAQAAEAAADKAAAAKK